MARRVGIKFKKKVKAKPKPKPTLDVTPQFPPNLIPRFTPTPTPRPTFGPFPVPVAPTPSYGPGDLKSQDRPVVIPAYTPTPSPTLRPTPTVTPTPTPGPNASAGAVPNPTPEYARTHPTGTSQFTPQYPGESATGATAATAAAIAKATGLAPPGQQGVYPTTTLTGGTTGGVPGTGTGLPSTSFQDYWKESGIHFSPIPDISGKVGAAYNPLLDYLKGQIPYWENREAKTSARLQKAYKGMGESSMTAAKWMADLGKSSGQDATARAQELVSSIEDTGKTTQKSFTDELARLGISDTGTSAVNEMQAATGKYGAKGVAQGLANANYTQSQAENWAAYEAAQKPIADMAYGEAVADLAMKIDAQINNVQGMTAQTRSEQAKAIADSLSQLRDLRVGQENNENSLRGSLLGQFYNNYLQGQGLAQSKEEADRQYALDLWKLQHPEATGSSGAGGTDLSGPDLAAQGFANYVAETRKDWSPEEQQRVIGLVTNWMNKVAVDLGKADVGANGDVDLRDYGYKEDRYKDQELTQQQILDWFKARDLANLPGEENINMSDEDRMALLKYYMDVGWFGNKLTNKPVSP